MTFVGVMTILVAIPPSLMLYGLPLLFAGIAALSARAALRRTPFVSPDMIPFLSKLKTFFSCLGWMYIIGMFILLIRNRFSGARAPARLPVRVRTQTG